MCCMSIQLIEKRPISIPGDPNSHKTTPPRRLLKKLARVMPISKTWGVFPIRLACSLSAGGIAQTGVVGRYVGRGGSEAPSVGTLLGMWAPGKAGRGGSTPCSRFHPGLPENSQGEYYNKNVSPCREFFFGGNGLALQEWIVEKYFKPNRPLTSVIWFAARGRTLL